MRPVTIMSRSSMMRHLLVEVLFIETIRIHVGTVQRIPFAPSCTSEQRQHGRPVWRFATSTQSPSGYDALSTNLVMQLHDDIETKIFQDRARETLRYDVLLQVMIGVLGMRMHKALQRLLRHLIAARRFPCLGGPGRCCLETVCNKEMVGG